MPGGEGMAPFTQREEVRRVGGEGFRLLRRKSLGARQDDDNGRGRFRGGFGNRGGGNDNRDDGDDNGGRRFGGRFGGGDNDDDDNNNRFRGGNRFGNNDGDGGGGGRFGGGNNGGGGGGGFGGGNNGGGGGGGGGFGGGNNGGGNGGGNGDGNGGGGNGGGNGDGNGGGGGFGGGGNGGGDGGGDGDGKPTSIEIPAPSSVPAPEVETPATPTTPVPETTPVSTLVPPAPVVTTPLEVIAAPVPEVELTTVVQISTMTITPTAGPPILNTVTEFVTLLTTELLPAPIPTETPNPDSLAAPAGPAPTPGPGDDLAEYAYTDVPPISTTTIDGSNSLGGDGLGTVPEAPAESSGAPVLPSPEAAGGGVDAVAERAMISVGSIAAFIMITSIGWFLWRRSRRKKNGTSSNGSSRSGPSFFQRVLPRKASPQLPSVKEESWKDLDESSISDARPTTAVSEKSGAPKAVPLGGFYGHENTYPYHPADDKKGRQPQLPRLQTTDIPPAPPIPHDTPSSGHPLSSHPVSSTKATAGDRSTTTLTPSTALRFSHHAQDSFSSTNAAQFGSIATVTTGLRAKMGPAYAPPAYPNQPDLARQPSAGKTARTSVMSSLSSGFGDGDIIVPGQQQQGRLAPPIVEPHPGNNYNTRFSWMSQGPKEPGGKRDTVLTQASEDLPPRFRSLTSWVDQQTGRIKRAQQRHDPASPAPVAPPAGPGIPGIHNPPPEQGYEMMMDTEQPRRVEDALAAAAAAAGKA